VVPLLGREFHREDLPIEVLLAELESPVDKIALKWKRKLLLHFWEKEGIKMLNEIEF
jgi:hypothetical protein